jgi:hypothetical protein
MIRASYSCASNQDPSPRSHLLGPPRFSTQSDDSLQLNANDFFRSSHIEPDPQFACAMVSLSPKRAIAPSTIMLPRCHGAARRRRVRNEHLRFINLRVEIYRVASARPSRGLWQSWRALYAVLPRGRRSQSGVVISLMVLGAIAELVTIGAVVPFLAVITNRSFYLHSICLRSCDRQLLIPPTSIGTARTHRTES